MVLSASARTCADAAERRMSRPMDIAAPVAATVMRAREDATVMDRICLWAFFCRWDGRSAGEADRRTPMRHRSGKLKCRAQRLVGTDGRRRRASRSPGTRRRTTARTARDTAWDSRSPAAMRGRPRRSPADERPASRRREAPSKRMVVAGGAEQQCARAADRQPSRPSRIRTSAAADDGGGKCADRRREDGEQRDRRARRRCATAHPVGRHRKRGGQQPRSQTTQARNGIGRGHGGVRPGRDGPSSRRRCRRAVRRSRRARSGAAPRACSRRR